MLRVVIWVLLISCVVVALIGLAVSLGEFGTTIFVLGSVGFLVLALAALAERYWFGK